NERQLYLASWGLFLALAMGTDRLRERWGARWVTAVAAIVLIMLGGITVSRNTVYRSEVALWEDTTRKSPGKARAWNNLGFAYGLAGRFRDAEAAYLRALAIDPGYALARGNLKALKAK
ncbi:MAG: tetratricopeptide repeat protein, partial [Candidatus Deferrimicrobiaceae bacterium]